MKNNNNLKNMFLIAATASALASGRVSDEKLDMVFGGEAALEALYANEDEIEKQCEEIHGAMKKIFAELDIQDLQEKSANEQKAAALKLLKYVVRNTEDKYDINDRVNRTPKQYINDEEEFKAEINLVHESLCNRKNLDMTAESTTLSFLFQTCGLDSTHFAIQKEIDIHTKGKHTPGKTMDEIIVINFADGKYICDPMYSKKLQQKSLAHNLTQNIFFTPKNYFENVKNGYQIVRSEKPAMATEAGMER